MKKVLFVLAALPILLFTACSGDGMKTKLEKYVIDNAGGVDIKYKLISYEMVDTITVGNMIDSLMHKFGLEDKKPNLEDFTRKRNQEFEYMKVIHPNYEEDVMRGELKDANPWTTELREITERADALIADWDNVTWHTYEYHYLYWWYKKWSPGFDRSHYVETVNAIFDLYDKSKADFDELENLLSMDRDGAYNYVVLHKYSIFNPLFQMKVTIENEVYFDKDMNYIRSESKNLDLK